MSIQSETERLLAGMCALDRAEALVSKRKLWRTVRRSGQPSNDEDKLQVVAVLNSALASDFPTATRREVLWMLSEIGGDESADHVAKLLMHKELREDARMVLERIPGDKSLAALEAGLATAPEDFKTSIAQSLRSRGMDVSGHPCQKLVPTKETTVKAIVASARSAS